MLTRALPSIRAASTIGLAAVSNSAIAFIYQILLARSLSPHEFGIFSSSLALVTTLATLAGFGLNLLWIKAFTENPVEAKRLLFGSYFIVIIIATSSIAAIAITGAQVPFIHENGSVIGLLSILIYSQSFAELLIARFQVERRETRVAVAMMMQNVTRITIVAILFTITTQPGISDIAAAHAISSVLVLAISIYGLRSFAGISGWFEIPAGLRKQIEGLKLSLKGAVPFGTAAFLQMLYYQSDLVMLPIFSTSEEAGLYGAAFVLIAATYVVPNAIIQRFFITRVHDWAGRDRVSLAQFLRLGTVGFLVAGTLIAISLVALSTTIIQIVFGPEYSSAHEVVVVLAISVPIIFASYASGSIITTRSLMPKKTKILAFVTTFNISANILLISRFGAVGAAWTTVASSILILILYGFTASKAVEKINIAS